MRNKKQSALGVKFNSYSRRDEITNMEGALHTFVAPVIPLCEMVGDYVYRGGHQVTYFGLSRNVKLSRSVVLSTGIQLDFENDEVMLVACRLADREVVGKDLLSDSKWDILSTERKQDEMERRRYDISLRCHMVFHLTHDHHLPARKDASAKDIMSIQTAIQTLSTLIRGDTSKFLFFRGKFIKLGSGDLLSLEMLYHAAVQQVRNELSALEAICSQGYVYTYDPAAIFAGDIGAQLLNRIMLCALKTISSENRFTNMKVYAFNHYAEPAIMPLVHAALEAQKDVRVLKKEHLFQGKGGTYEVAGYRECEGAMLVLHNNSDGFGQNIETEGMGGSMDGAIGASSSAAASLERSRKDLLHFVC